jgi:hypothetical protein
MASWEDSNYTRLNQVKTRIARTYPGSSSYAINRGNINNRLTVGGEDWLGISLLQMSGPEGESHELAELFNDRKRLAYIKPEILAVEALRLNSFRNRSLLSDKRRINAALFVGGLKVDGNDIFVVGVHVQGGREEGLLKPVGTSAEDDFEELRRPESAIQKESIEISTLA